MTELLFRSGSTFKQVQRKSQKGRAVDAILTTNSHLKQRVAESIKLLQLWSRSPGGTGVGSRRKKCEEAAQEPHQVTCGVQILHERKSSSDEDNTLVGCRGSTFLSCTNLVRTAWCPASSIQPGSFFREKTNPPLTFWCKWNRWMRVVVNPKNLLPFDGLRADTVKLPRDYQNTPYNLINGHRIH